MHQINYLLVVIPVLIWSSMGILVRLSSLSGDVIFFFAALVASLLFCIEMARQGRLIKFFKKKGYWILALLGFSAVLNNVSYFYAYRLTTIANAVFVHYLAPALVVIAAPIILGEKTRKKIWLSVVIALAGLFILLWPVGLDLSSDHLAGIGLAALSAVGYALGIVLTKKACDHFESIEIVFGSMIVCVLLLFPYVIYQDPQVQMNDVMIFVVLGIFYQGLAVLLFVKALNKLKAQNVSVVTYLEPVGAAVLAALCLAELPGIYTLAGGSLILCSCFLTIFLKKEPKS
jgi:drug/metabolite transporter (DMT)-like permease